MYITFLLEEGSETDFKEFSNRLYKESKTLWPDVPFDLVLKTLESPQRSVPFFSGEVIRLEKRDG